MVSCPRTYREAGDIRVYSLPDPLGSITVSGGPYASWTLEADPGGRDHAPLQPPGGRDPETLKEETQPPYSLLEEETLEAVPPHSLLEGLPLTWIRLNTSLSQKLLLRTTPLLSSACFLRTA